MTIEEYKAQVFKYDGNGPVTIGDIWGEIPRAGRRMIERIVRQGGNPDVLDFLRFM